MKNKGQVQTNEHKVNVLVDTVNSDNRHFSHLNRRVKVIKVLSDDEIIQLWKNRKEKNELELAKDWIEKQDGYAYSNCTDKTLNIQRGSIVKYTKP